MFLSACSKPNVPRTQTSPLTSSEALAIVEERIDDYEKEVKKDFLCEYDGKQCVSENEYHRVRVYTISTEELYDAEGTPYKQSFTHAWLYVDINTGKIYQEQSGTIEVLVPWP